jgi:hypothetical protein
MQGCSWDALGTELQELVASKCRTIDRLRLSLTCRDANSRWFDHNLAMPLRFFLTRVIFRGPLTLSAPSYDDDFTISSMKVHLQPGSVSSLHLRLLQEYWQDGSKAQRVEGGLQEDDSLEISFLDADKNDSRVRFSIDCDYLQWQPLKFDGSRYLYAVVELEHDETHAGVLKLKAFIHYIHKEGVWSSKASTVHQLTMKSYLGIWR